MIELGTFNIKELAPTPLHHSQYFSLLQVMKVGCGPGATTELPVQTHSILLSSAPETCKEAMHPVGKIFFRVSYLGRHGCTCLHNMKYTNRNWRYAWKWERVRNKSAEKSMVQLGFKPEIKLTSPFTASYSYYFEGFSNNQDSRLNSFRLNWNTLSLAT